MSAEIILSVDDVSKSFSRQSTLLHTLRRGPDTATRAVDHVSLKIARGEIFGLVGESGCGKSTLARIAAGLIKPDSGAVSFQAAGGQRAPRIQMIFQDPFSSLNARWSVERIIAEPIRVHGLRARDGVHARVAELLEQVGLAASDARKYPQDFSGGQCQRISIARALAGEPDFLILDEPTSALDVSVQAQILALLQDLQARLGLTCLFITHNLGVVRALARRVGVMYLGQIVELGDTAALFAAPRHPYTRLLIDAAPDIDTSDRALAPIPGDLSGTGATPPGCRFHPRCPWSQDVCRVSEPQPVLNGAGFCRCHFPLNAVTGGS